MCVCPPAFFVHSAQAVTLVSISVSTGFGFWLWTATLVPNRTVATRGFQHETTAQPKPEKPKHRFQLLKCEYILVSYVLTTCLWFLHASYKPRYLIMSAWAD